MERLKDLANRAVTTAAEGALIAIGHETVQANALAFDWTLMGGYALGGAVLSLLINISREGLFGRKRAGK